MDVSPRDLPLAAELPPMVSPAWDGRIWEGAQ